MAAFVSAYGRGTQQPLTAHRSHPSSDTDTLDWKVAGTPDFLTAVQSVYNSIPAGATPIVLNHDLVLETGTQSLPWVLGTWLPSRGLRAVTLGECLGLPNSNQWYTAITTQGRVDATWTCAGTPTPGSLV